MEKDLTVAIITKALQRNYFLVEDAMIVKILEFLDDQIHDAEILRAGASANALENIIGTINAFEAVKEFIEQLEDK